MTWLSFCARYPGPEWKQGYGTGARTKAQIEGVVDHSMEGSMAGAYSVLFGPAKSSWPFSIPKVGEPVQHYPLKSITWHAGLPGDRRQDTSLIGNLTLVGKEHEGVAGEPWTENQIFWSAKIDVALRALCPAFGANPPTLRLNMWEHNWLSATSCPSGRNPWVEKFTLINELEDDMAWTEAEKKHVENITKQIDELRATLGMDPAFGNDYPPATDLLKRLANVKAVVAQNTDQHQNPEKHVRLPGGGVDGPTLEEIVDALEVELKLR